jgi:predicted nucleotidyltransferase
VAELVETTRWYVERLSERLRATVGDRLVSLIVYGSRARGTHRADSDLDVLLVVRDLPRPRIARHALFRPIKQAIDQEHRRIRGSDPPYLAYLVKTPEEAAYHSPLYLDMTEDAVLVYDREGFFEGILDAMRGRMAALGSRRVWLDGGWYWLLQPGAAWGERIEI